MMMFSMSKSDQRVAGKNTDQAAKKMRECTTYPVLIDVMILH